MILATERPLIHRGRDWLADSLRNTKREETFREYVERVAPWFEWYRHNEEVAEVLQRVADGELGRVMIFEPPRHGKTEQVSRLFPAYFLDRFPERWVGVTSYGADLSYGFSRKARENFREGGGVVAADSAAVSEWGTAAGGGLWAAGVGGAITGKGFHLGLIDDPLKNREEAESEGIRQKQIEWYDSTFYTRREPGAAIVIVVTRWHAKDLAGHLLERSQHGGDAWYVVALDAVREERDYSVPETCDIHPDWREEDEPLCPERFDEDELERTKANMTPYEWSALYQQRPTAREGNRFKRDWFNHRIPRPPIGKHIRRVRWWDEGATQGGGDFTAGVRMSRNFKTGRFAIEHVKKGQWSSGNRDVEQRDIADADANQFDNQVIQGVQQEPGSSGKDRAHAFVRLMKGRPARFDPVTGDKEIRADSYASDLELGNVDLVDDGTWDVEAFIDEHLSFPNGAHDDQVDAAAEAYNKLAEMRAPVDADAFLAHA